MGVGLLLLLGIPAGILTWFSMRPLTLQRPVLVEVESGRSFTSVAQELEQVGVVVDGRALRLLARLMQADRGIHAGVYRFSGAQTPLKCWRFCAVAGWRWCMSLSPKGCGCAKLPHAL